MTTKIRPCLYIGLGGTGMNAILNTKKMYLDTYGEVPPMIAFLGIDTDGGEYDKEVLLKNGERTKLAPDEQRAILVGDPRPLYQKNPDDLAWFPKERNSRGLNGMKTGAGQIRSNGRFAFWCNHKEVLTSINEKLHQIRRMEHVDNEKYSLLSNATPEIHMVFSLCGGTGCGTFLSVAYLIKKNLTTVPQPRLVGYGVLPGVFIAMDELKMPNVRANAYGALKDLDYLMYGDLDRAPFDIANMKDHWSTNVRPFDAFMLIDNKNNNGDTLTKVDQISQMLSLSLVAAAGEVSVANASTLDNIMKQVDSGDMDVDGKQAWASGLGVCEITVNSQALGALYSMKAAQRIINNLLAAKADATDVATNWINKMEIRENEHHDQVIDYMLPKMPRQTMPEIMSTEAPTDEVEGWLRRVAREADDIRNYPAKVRELSEKVSLDLDAFVKSHLNQPGGVKDTENILTAILAQIELCDGEMHEELKHEQDRTEMLEGSLKAAISVLATYKKPFFGKSRTEEYKEAVAGAARNLAVNLREKARREAAINFYSGLKEMLADYLQKVNDIEHRLIDFHKKLENDIAKRRHGIEAGEQIFQIDLTKEFIDKVKVSEEESLVSYFLQQADIFNMSTKKEAELQQIFLSYTNNLAGAKEWCEKTIENVMHDMDEAALDRMLDRAVRKSEPLLNFDYQHLGKFPNVTAQNFFYVGVYDKDHSVLTPDIMRRHLDAADRPSFCNIGSKTSVILYRQIGTIPPCTLLELNSYKEAAEKSKWDVHFDCIIEARMNREGWSLYPTEAASDALQLWIKGFIFNLIRNEKGRYQYQDFNESSRALQGYWVDLDHPKSGDRATAFALFKQKMMNEDIHRAFVEELQKRISKIGDDQYQEKLQQVRDVDFYYDNVSQINLRRETLNNAGYENINKQITEEVDYIVRMLE